MSKREALLRYIEAGVPQEAAAKAVGVSASYVSQLCSEDEEFKLALANQATASATKYRSFDAQVDLLESTLLSQVQRAVDDGLFIRNNELLKALAVVTSIKRRAQLSPADKETAQNNGQNIYVSLNISPSLEADLKVNANNEVVEVDGRPLITMQPTRVVEMLEERKQHAIATNNS